MQTLNTKFEHELKKRIATEMQRLAECLAIGNGIDDYAHYRYYTGQIAALDRVISEYCDDVNKTINEER